MLGLKGRKNLRMLGLRKHTRILFAAVIILSIVVTVYKTSALSVSLPAIPQDLQFWILIADIAIAVGIFGEVLQNFLGVGARRGRSTLRKSLWICRRCFSLSCISISGL